MTGSLTALYWPSIAFYWPSTTKYKPVLPYTDPVPSWINHHLILIHCHHAPTRTPWIVKSNNPLTYTVVAWGLQTPAQFTPGFVALLSLGSCRWTASGDQTLAERNQSALHVQKYSSKLSGLFYFSHCLHQDQTKDEFNSSNKDRQDQVKSNFSGASQWWAWGEPRRHASSVLQQRMIVQTVSFERNNNTQMPRFSVCDHIHVSGDIKVRWKW